MRIILGTVFAIGTLMTAGAAMLAIDMLVTDEHRAAVKSTVGGYVDEQATRYEKNEHSFRQERRWLRALSTIKAMKDGIFRSQDLGLPAALPAAPLGWERIDYVTAHGETITGAALERTPLATTTTNSILLDFEKAIGGRSLKARATYRNGDSLIALRMVGNMQVIRAVEEGRWKLAARPSAPFAKLHGLAVVLHPQVSTHALSGKAISVDYRRFTINLGGMVEIEILTNASDVDVLDVLSGIDMQAIQAGLPHKTEGYLEGADLTHPLPPANNSQS